MSWKMKFVCSISSVVEQRAYDAKVTGSIPVWSILIYNNLKVNSIKDIYFFFDRIKIYKIDF